MPGSVGALTDHGAALHPGAVTRCKDVGDIGAQMLIDDNAAMLNCKARAFKEGNIGANADTNTNQICRKLFAITDADGQYLTFGITNNLAG